MSDEKINEAAEKRAQAHLEELTAALGVEREGYVRRGLTDRVEAVDAQLRAIDGTPTEPPADEAVDAQLRAIDGTPTEPPADEAVDASASEPAPAEELEPAPDAGPGLEPEREASPRKTTRKAR